MAKGEELALRIAALVAGRIGASAHAHPQTAPLATARALAGRSTSALVYVQSEISKGDLRTTVDVYPSMANAWDRIRNPLPAPMGHAFATAKLDAEVRAFLTPLVLELATVHHAKHEEGDVLAAACGDVDGDGGNEVVLVSQARVTLGRVRAGVFVAERTTPWAALGPRVPVPMREPLGGAALALGTVDVGTTDRGGTSLAADFSGRTPSGPAAAGHTPLAGIPMPGGGSPVCLMAQASAGAFDGAPVDCAAPGDPKPKMAVPSPRFDAFAAASIVWAGAERQVVAVREPSGKLKVRLGRWDERTTVAGALPARSSLLAIASIQDGVAGRGHPAGRRCRRRGERVQRGRVGRAAWASSSGGACRSARSGDVPRGGAGTAAVAGGGRRRAVAGPRQQPPLATAAGCDVTPRQGSKGRDDRPSAHPRGRLVAGARLDGAARRGGTRADPLRRPDGDARAVAPDERRSASHRRPGGGSPRRCALRFPLCAGRDRRARSRSRRRGGPGAQRTDVAHPRCAPKLRFASGAALDARAAAFSIGRARARDARAWLAEVPTPACR